MITKRSISKPNSIEEFGEIAKQKETFFQFLLLASTIQFSNHHAPHDQTGTRTGHHVGIEPRHENPWGGDPGAQKHTHTTPGPTARPASKPMTLPHQHPHDAIDCHAIVWRTPSKKHGLNSP